MRLKLKNTKSRALLLMLISLLLVVGFIFRVYGLSDNYSFWSDEVHVAIFARAILQRGKPILENGYSTGIYQPLQYWLSAISASIFGLTELALRLPSVIFGVLTIPAVYLLGKELFDKKTGLLAAATTTFLAIEILWSRQARPYQALQLFYLTGAYFAYKLANSDNLDIKLISGFLISGALAVCFHVVGWAIIFNTTLYLLIIDLKRLKKAKMWLALMVIASLFFFPGIKSLVLGLGEFNHLFYYRIFLTDNYLPLAVLAGLGGVLLLFKKDKKRILLFGIFLGTQLFTISFLLGQPFVRYFYIVFPFIILLAAHGVTALANIPKHKPLRVILLFLLIAVLGLRMKEKFVFWPRATYSLNEDMQEIPEVDWKGLYQLVGEKLAANPESILITNWNDLPVWYLGEGKLDYLIREKDQQSDPLAGTEIVNSLEKFKEIVKNKESGLVILDSWDDYVPEGIREYCRDNLKKEFEIDRLYPQQPRYWPVNVYSWGLE